jgi:tetratricopeptide (TPR) repeat protein
LTDVTPQVVLLAALIGLTAMVWRYRPALGFLGIWFFLTLAVTSSLVPIATEVGAERRMYLPLMALVVLAVSFATWLSNQITMTSFVKWGRMAALSGLWAAAAVPLAAGTVSRNRDYSSALRLAQTVVDRWPTGRARGVLATELLEAGRRDEAYAYIREAIRDDPRSHYTFGIMLFQDGRLPEAREQLEQFVQQEPYLLEAVNARVLMGRALIAEGRLDAAATQFTLAATMQPSFADAHLGLGEVRFAQRQFEAALGEYKIFLEGGPGNAGVWLNVGIALQHMGYRDEAIDAWRRAAVLDPQSPLPHRNLAAVLLERGDISEAADHAARALVLRPDDAASHDLLGVALLAQHKVEDAVSEFQESLRLDPTDTDVHAHLQQALGMRGSRRGP